ncbi:sulfite exporter TauE/SafE family protein [Pelagibacterium limicola]|uniref:sulfite exporter TauE/SafE family protein n=1 Tax=Pelagibacterium limicola TaxID=2791022 RepID=UPI0018AF871A|nr:sulfite exporter TauE/SafE family protein [Pelagibacterium limicola]
MPIYLPIAELSVDLFFLIGIGAAIGFISGLFGVGGGFLLTPLLLFSGVPAPVAVGSVTAQVVASSTSGALSYIRRGAIDLHLGGFLVMGGIFGSFAGVWIFGLLRAVGQLDLFISLGYLIFLGSVGVLMMIEAVRSLLKSRLSGPRAPRRLPGQHSWVQILPGRVRFKKSRLYISIIPILMIGFAIGIVGALLGIGGGFILVPALVYILRVPGSVVVGTSLLHLLAVMAVTCILHATQSQSVDILLAFCLMVGSVAGAQFGASAGQHLRGDQLRALLALIVLGVALRFALSLFIAPDDPFSMSVIGFGETA